MPEQKSNLNWGKVLAGAASLVMLLVVVAALAVAIGWVVVWALAALGVPVAVGFNSAVAAFIVLTLLVLILSK